MIRCVNEYGQQVTCPVTNDYSYITFGVIAFAIFVSLWALWFLWLWIGPKYGIYRQRLKGQADLAEAEFESRVRVTRAHAEQDAAKHEAEADIIRAKGIAASIGEVENKLGGPEGYLRWKYIHMLEENSNISTVVYVPTEASLPILEAGKIDARAKAVP